MATSDSSRDAYRDYTAQRMARSRQRAAKQKRTTGLIILALLLLTALLIFLRAPRAPQLVVTWPNPQKYGKRVLNNDATVLLRSGQPFSVSVTDASNWNVSGSTKDMVVKGERITWSPTENSSTLEVRCKPVANGVYKLVSWLWPTRTLKLHGTTGVPAGGARVHLDMQPGTAVWIASQVLADGKVTWDERVIPLLQFVAAGDGTPAKGAPHWTLTNSFGGSPLKGDNGTYARLASPQKTSANNRIEGMLSDAARQVAQRSPNASIKFIARHEKGVQSGVLRIAFDGTEARGGWVRENGQSAPFFWWEDLNSSSNSDSALQPSLPRR